MSAAVIHCLGHINNISNPHFVRNADAFSSQKEVELPLDWIEDKKKRVTPSHFKVAYCFFLGYYFSDEVWFIIFKKVKFVDHVNVSARCKRFLIILTNYREYKQTLSISKRTFNFDDYYTEFLQTQMLDLKKAVQNKFKEKEIRDEFFFNN